MKKTKSIILSGIVATLLSSNVNASEIGIEKKISVTNNYVSRGMTQTNDKGAVFGEVTFSYDSFFAGIWASNVEWEGADADSEVDFYAGYATAFGDLDAVLSYTRFAYPNSKDVNNLDEATLDLTYHIDNFAIGAKYALSTYVEHDGTKLDYMEAYATYDFEKYSVKVAAGSLEDIGDNQSIGVSRTIDLNEESITLDLTYSDFQADTISGMKDEDNLFATVVYSF